MNIFSVTTGFSPPPPASPDSVGDDAMDGITEITEEQHNEDNDPDLANVFTLDRDLGIHDIEGQRVLQVSSSTCSTSLLSYTIFC